MLGNNSSLLCPKCTHITPHKRINNQHLEISDFKKYSLNIDKR